PNLLQPPLDHTLQLGVGFLPLPSKQSTVVSEAAFPSARAATRLPFLI
nr:hypothetical protein [Tanacetum cinerariifolium]